MAAPANDNFANAQIITGEVGTVTGTNVDATTEGSEPAVGIGGWGNTGTKSVWYRWTAPTDGLGVVDTLGTAFDTVLDVFTGSAIGALSLVASNDDAYLPGGGSAYSNSRVVFDAVAGTTYQIRVLGWGSANSGTIALNWSVRVALVNVVDQDGSVVGTLDNARVTRLSMELNGAGGAEFSLPTTDAGAALALPGKEIQVFYPGNPNPIFWGPIVRPQGGLHESTWQCAGLLWYFGHRFMGRADRTNLLVNGDFEDDENDWSFSGVTHSISTSTVNDGTKSLKLEAGTADHDDNAYQIWTHPTGGYPTGDYVTASAWVYIPSADYLGGALNDFGLVVVHRGTDGNAIDAGIAEIGDDTERDVWIPLETGVSDVLEGHTVEVRLFPPHGSAYFDTVTLTYMESLSFGYPPPAADVTDIVTDIVEYAQDNLAGFTHGKSDLHIGTTGAATGRTRQIAYQFAEHRNILDAILEYVRNGDCDISIEHDTATRTFTVWPKTADTRTPKFGKGVLYGTTLELDVNVADFSWAQDLENGASSVVLLGPGDGPDRPEGGASDSSLVGGSFTLEIVEQAPDNTTVGQLDLRAQERVAVAARPEIFEVTTLPGAGVIGDLQVGDTVPVIISRGWVDIDDTYRVVRIEADLRTDQATITLNAIP